MPHIDDLLQQKRIQFRSYSTFICMTPVLWPILWPLFLFVETQRSHEQPIVRASANIVDLDEWRRRRSMPSC
jgi:hypothetical protein